MAIDFNIKQPSNIDDPYWTYGDVLSMLQYFLQGIPVVPKRDARGKNILDKDGNLIPILGPDAMELNRIRGICLVRVRYDNRSRHFSRNTAERGFDIAEVHRSAIVAAPGPNAQHFFLLVAPGKSTSSESVAVSIQYDKRNSGGAYCSDTEGRMAAKE
jgi:hypothetical protein